MLVDCKNRQIFLNAGNCHKKMFNLLLHILTVPDRKRRVIPEVVLVRPGVLRFGEFGKGRAGGRGVGSKGVSLQATWD